MRKRIAFLSFAAALVFCYSCSNDETVAVNTTPQDNEISFRPLVNNVTRAAASVNNVDGTSIQSGFVVNAMEANTETAYFSNVTYTWNSTAYTSATKYYWPASGNLDFYAYAFTDFYEGNTGDQITITNYKTFVVTPFHEASNDASTPFQATNQVDLVYGATKGKNKTNDGAGVTLNFRHTGAKIVCKVKNSSSALKFTVEGWKIGFLSPNGTFTFSDANTDGNNTGSTLSAGQWGTLGSATIDTQYASYPSSKNIAVNTGVTDLDGEMILIPQTLTAATAYASTAASADLNGTFIAVQLKAQDANDHYIAGAAGSYLWAIWPTGGYSWEPGKKYTYTIDLAGGGYYEKNQDSDVDLDPILDNSEIKFVTVTVDDWVDHYVDVPEVSYAYAVGAVAGTYNITSIAGTYQCAITGLTASQTYNLSEESEADWLSEPVSITSDANGKAILSFTVVANTSGYARNANIVLTQSDDASINTKVTVAQAVP